MLMQQRQQQQHSRQAGRCSLAGSKRHESQPRHLCSEPTLPPCRIRKVSRMAGHCDSAAIWLSPLRVATAEAGGTAAKSYCNVHASRLIHHQLPTHMAATAERQQDAPR